MTEPQDAIAAGLDRLNEGFGIFDADLRLVASNRLFAELRDYPDALRRTGTELEHLLRHSARRGDFGPGDPEQLAALRLADIRDHAEREVEREMPDGRILRIVYRHLADGGLCLIYEDKTAEHRAQAAVKASEERYALVTRALSEGVYDWNVKDDQLHVSERLNEIFDFEPGELLSKTWADRIHPEDLERYVAALGSHFKGETDRMICEYRIRDKSDTYRWVADHGIGERGADGRVHRLVGAVREVTALKQANQEKDQLVTELNAVLDTIDYGVLFMGPDLRGRVVNRAFREMWGFPESFVATRPTMAEFIEFNRDTGIYDVAPEDFDAYVAARVAAIRQGDIPPGEMRLADGRVLRYHGVALPSGGRMLTYFDLTEWKQRERELAEQSAILEATLENINQGISMVDADLKVIAFNRRFLELMQFPVDEFKPGFHMAQAFRYNAARGEYGPGDVEAQIKERLELSAKFLPHEFERARPDGIVLEIIGRPVEGGGLVTTYTDITERKRREREIAEARDAAEAALADLRQAQDRLVQAEKMASLGQLTAGIAHEIKNPLNFVNNFAKLSVELLDEFIEVATPALATLSEEDRADIADLTETLQQNLHKIAEHGARADGIVKNMLAHSREGPSEIRLIELNAVVEEALNLAYHGARAEDSTFNITLAKDLAPDVGDIECYPQDLSRVFLNLMSNGFYAANKRRQDGDGIEPTLTVRSFNLGDQVAVEISDNGTGMPPEIQDKIFTPFFTTKPAGEGTGLGLSLSFDIVVKQHAGDLTVKSRQGEGTTFVVSLPRQAPKIAARAEPTT